jgi:hypothetical protein
VACDICSTKASDRYLAKHRNRIKQNECVGCGNKLQIDEKYRCKICSEIHKERSRAKWMRDRKTVLNHYGHKCVCCGEDVYEFLEVDHINGGGTKQRKARGNGHFTTWIIRNNFPTDLRILCANCNRGVGHYGICPHHKEPELAKSKDGKRCRKCRKKVIEHYGGKCKCCGESNQWFLELDHINNDGNIQRKTVKIDVRWVIKNNFPDNLQLLCGNCNKAKGLYGVCPHSSMQK